MGWRRATTIIVALIFLSATATAEATASGVEARAANNPLSVAARSPANSATPVTSALFAARTPACKKATKAVKRAWRARVTAKASGSIHRFVVADEKWRKAKIKKRKACRAIVANPDATYSGELDDPRPVGWIRPADGSGLPGSNATWVKSIPAGCPLTISGYELLGTEGSLPIYSVVIRIENYTRDEYVFTYTLDLVDDSGRVKLGQQVGRVNINSMSENGRIAYGFEWRPELFDSTSARPSAFTVLTCKVL